MTEYTTRPLLDDDDEDEEDEEGKTPKIADFVGKGLLEQRIIMVAKPVDRELMAQVTAQLLVLNARDAEAPVTMYINCPGGDAYSGFGIYDAMKLIDAPVTTVCAGLSASAAIIIQLGGAKGRRFTLPHSRFLIHQPSSYSRGSASDLEITANEIVKTRTLYNKIISDETGRSEKQILKDADRDFWLDPDEAKEYGLVDAVITSLSEIPG